MRTHPRLDLKVGRVAPRAVELFNVGQASRLPSECASASTKANPSPASLTGAGGTPALLCRLGLEPRRVAQSCREALPVPSESGSKLHAVQTLARSCGAGPLREAFGVRPACRRFGVETARGRAERQPGWLRSLLSPELIHLRPSFIALTCAAALLLTSALKAQTFTTLHSFTANDGSNPYAGLILSGKTLYGTANGGGSSGNGTVFAVNTDGSGFTTLHSFTAASVSVATNSDGANPLAGLTLSANTLYGTANEGGSSGSGTVFSISLPVTPPQLTIITAGANVILTWPTNAAGFTLQSAPTLTATFTSILGATSPYTNAIAGLQQFFRLATP